MSLDYNLTKIADRDTLCWETRTGTPEEMVALVKTSAPGTFDIMTPTSAYIPQAARDGMFCRGLCIRQSGWLLHSGLSQCVTERPAS